MSSDSTEESDLLALRETELNFRHMAENVPGALFQYVQYEDGRNHVTYMSPRCLELWEVPPERIQEDSSVLWQMVHPEDRPGMAASVAESARTFSPWYWEWRITTPSGKEKWLQGSGRPMYRDADSVKWNTFILDVTERRSAEDLARQLRAQLRQAEQLESLGRLAGGIAHDVNNVLTVVIGFSEAALEAVPATSPAREDIAEILSAAGRAGALTRQLLTFARGQPSMPVVFDPADRLEDSSLMLQRLVGGRVQLEYAVADHLPMVAMDPSQFDQVVTNLVLNARDAIPETGCITVSLTGTDEWIELAVSDDGVGMDEETQVRIFEPFFSTKPESRGTGLGLPTVRGIVVAAGGHVSVTSEPGVGSTFRVQLPVSNALPTEPIELHTASTPPLPSRILLCDDDTQLRRVVERVLIRHGIEVRVAGDPQSALPLVGDWTPDMVVTDVVMGGGGGMALMTNLRKQFPNIPALYVTGYVGNDFAQHMLNAGNAKVLLKPFRSAELIQAIRQTWKFQIE